MKHNRFDWGETVEVISEAPKSFRPGEHAEICSVWAVSTPQNAVALGEAIGSKIYSVEFGDGTLMEIPERYLVNRIRK